MVKEQPETEGLDNNQLQELRYLLCSWEDDNISDHEFCNKTGDILSLGNWTWKGSDSALAEEKKLMEEECNGTKD